MSLSSSSSESLSLTVSSSPSVSQSSSSSVSTSYSVSSSSSPTVSQSSSSSESLSLTVSSSPSVSLTDSSSSVSQSMSSSFSESISSTSSQSKSQWILFSGYALGTDASVPWIEVSPEWRSGLGLVILNQQIQHFSIYILSRNLLQLLFQTDNVKKNHDLLISAILCVDLPLVLYSNLKDSEI